MRRTKREALLDALNAHNNPCSRKHNNDADGEYHDIAVEDHEDSSGEHRTHNRADSVCEVKNTEVLTCLFWVRKNSYVQSLIDCVVYAISEASDECEQVHTDGVVENHRHCPTSQQLGQIRRLQSKKQPK